MPTAADSLIVLETPTRRLESALDAELTQLQALHALLAAEEVAMLRRDCDAISELARAKSRALEQLATAAALSRAEHLAYVGGTSRPDTVPLPGRCATLARAVRQGWRKAEASNRCNGAVMRLHQASVQRGLGVLRQAMDSTELYGANGRARGHYLSM